MITLVACSTPGPGEAPDGVWDPYEASNRQVHAFNKKVDGAVLRPGGKGYVTVVPEGVRYNISSLADNLGTPSSIVNQLLQGDIGGASRNTLRFAVNMTLGFGGIADPASELGLTEEDTDFGETLAVWGVAEGAYLELPFLGPSTERDAAGRVVDIFLDPLGYAIAAPESHYARGVKILSKVGDRGTFGDTVDSILYDSADSYAQTRLYYLQNRRFELDEDVQDNDIDPYQIETEGF